MTLSSLTWQDEQPGMLIFQKGINTCCYLYFSFLFHIFPFFRYPLPVSLFTPPPRAAFVARYGEEANRLADLEEDEADTEGIKGARLPGFIHVSLITMTLQSNLHLHLQHYDSQHHPKKNLCPNPLQKKVRKKNIVPRHSTQSKLNVRLW